MSWDALIDPIAGFLGQDAESQVGNLRKNLDGQYKPTIMDSFWGRANDGQQALDTQENTVTRKKYKPLLESVGKTWTDGMSAGTAAEMYQTGKQTKERETTAQINADAFNSPQQVEERRKRDQQFNAGRTDVANQMELTRMQMATNEKNRLADRADAREARADELQLERDRMERADRKDERNRRRDSIAALTSGLAALGAAFAL